MTDYLEGWWEPIYTHGGQQGLASLRVICGARRSQTHSIRAPHQLKSGCLAWPLLEVYTLADAFCAFNKRLENASQVTIGKDFATPRGPLIPFAINLAFFGPHVTTS